MKFTTRIAIRHLRSKHSFGFIAFSSFFSIIGLMLGISSLIIISCVSDGFDNVINFKLSGIDGHIRINNHFINEMTVENGKQLDSIVQNVFSSIKYTAPYIEKHAIIRKGSRIEGIIVYGVPEPALNKIFHLDQFSKSKPEFQSNYGIIIGQRLAESLNIKADEDVLIFNPESMQTIQLYDPEIFTVENTFQTDFPEYDRRLAFIPLKTAQKFFGIDTNISGLILNVDNPQKVEETDILLSNVLREMPYMTTTWKERHSSLLQWLNIYDIPISLIMYFITAVGVFNIAASLWMIIIEKTGDFGILQSMGLSKSEIVYIIMKEGAIIGLLGSILGILFSFTILYLESVYHIIQLPSEIYFMDYLPIDISPYYFILYPLITFIITIALTYLPAIKASNISIAEALRYE